MRSELTIEKFRLLVNLGWGEEERRVPQAVDVSYKLRFKEAPRACVSDELGETLCYAQLSEKIRAYCEKRSFKLLESFGAELYGLLKSESPEGVRLTVEVTKVNPPIAGLAGGVSFRYGDEEW